MPLGDYLAGLVFFAGTWGGAAYVAFAVERKVLPRLPAAPRALALALLFLSALIAVHVLPGMLGLLNREAVLVAALLASAVAWRVPRVRRPAPAAVDPPAPPADRLPSVALAAFAVLAVGAVLVAALSEVRGAPPDGVDAMSFALPGVAHWIHTGSIWDVGSFLGLIQVRTYPNNGDVLALATILPWRNDAFLWILPLPLLGMTGLAVYACARELAAPAATAAIAGAAVVAAKTVAEPALHGLKPDAFMYATFATGLLFLLRQVRTGARSDLVLAGVGLGLAFGSRWYGLPLVALVLVVWLAGLAVARRPRVAALARDGAIVVALVLAAGGFWLLRNLALTGNPLYPVKVQLLGVTLLDAPRDILTEKAGYSVVDRLGQAGFVRHELYPALRSALGLPGLLALLGSALALVLTVRGGVRRIACRPFCVVAAAGAAALLYAILPAGAQGLAAHAVPGIVEANARWLVPAFILGAAASAWAVGKLGRWRVVAEGAGVVAVVTSLGGAFDVPWSRVLLAGAALAALWLLARRGPRMVPRLGPALQAGAVAALVLVCTGVGYAHQHGYNEHRFAGRTPVVDWVLAHDPAGAKIGMAGHWTPQTFVPIYALFGPELENDVAYVGPLVSNQVRFYRDAASFRRAVRRYDLVAVGRLEAPDFEHPRAQRTLADPRDARWARSAGFREVARDQGFILLARRRATG